MHNTEPLREPYNFSFFSYSSLIGGGGGGWARLLPSVCVFKLGFGEGGGPFSVRQLQAKASPSFSQI
jgi:hypothetical protein